MNKPWAKFSVGHPSGRPGSTPDCRPISSIAHIAHVPAAIRIVEDGWLRAGLVFDQSKLNRERIRVVWLSPNDWSNGFRYGNVGFHFDWATLIKGKRIYWVESMPQYSPEACRILLADVDYSGVLDRYEPGDGDGPWWRSPSGEHFWNGLYCLEVMFEGDIDLARAARVDFVKHHPSLCCIHGSCRYRAFAADKAGAEFVAALVSRGASLKHCGLVENTGKGQEPSSALEGAVGILLLRCGTAGRGCSGRVIETSSAAAPLARAVLASLGNPGLAADLAELATQFASADDLRHAVTDLIGKAAGLPDGSSLYDL
jgi:hypothetical protein